MKICMSHLSVQNIYFSSFHLATEANCYIRSQNDMQKCNSHLFATTFSPLHSSNRLLIILENPCFDLSFCLQILLPHRVNILHDFNLNLCHGNSIEEIDMQNYAFLILALIKCFMFKRGIIKKTGTLLPMSCFMSHANPGLFSC